jgi:hypothetical protein
LLLRGVPSLPIAYGSSEMTATPDALMVAVSAPSPPRTITAGKGPVPAGRSTEAEKEALRPLWDVFTVMPVRETVPVTLCGLGGFVP